MIITLPEDVIRLEHSSRKDKKRFGFSKQFHRMTMPREVLRVFDSKKYGIDIWISKQEKSVYLEFVPKEKGQFTYSNSNGYVGCKDLFKWLEYQEIPVFDDYEYTDYQIDVKHKMVKVNLERK